MDLHDARSVPLRPACPGATQATTYTSASRRERAHRRNPSVRPAGTRCARTAAAGTQGVAQREGRVEQVLLRQVHQDRTAQNTVEFPAERLAERRQRSIGEAGFQLRMDSPGGRCHFRHRLRAPRVVTEREQFRKVTTRARAHVEHAAALRESEPEKAGDGARHRFVAAGDVAGVQPVVALGIGVQGEARGGRVIILAASPARAAIAERVHSASGPGFGAGWNARAIRLTSRGDGMSRLDTRRKRPRHVPHARR